MTGISFKTGMDQAGRRGPGLVHDRDAQKVRQVAADQRQHKPDRHLRLFQGDAAEGNDQGHQGADQHPGQKTQQHAAGPVGNRKAAHGREQDRPVHRQVDDASALGDGLTDHGKQDRRSRCQNPCQTNQDGIRIHAGS